MSIHASPPPAVDLLAQGIQRVRRGLLAATTLPQRVRIFCAGLKVCRDLGASDVVHDEFVLLAVDSGLFDEFASKPPYAAAAMIDHLIRFTFLEGPVRRVTT
jgi:hypothetical protein